MNFSAKFAELDKAIHDQVAFDCGEDELNIFLKTQAARHMKVGISKTMILPGIAPLSNGKYPICSFYTLAPSSIKRHSLPPEIAKNLPNYPVPVFLIAQLAVHKECHEKGLGKITLIKALEYLWEINIRMSVFAIVVDCLNKSVEQFYAKYGFKILCKHNGKIRMFIPMKTVAKLF